LRLGRALIFAVVLLPLAAARVAACSCGGYPSPAEAHASADAVFVGGVVRATPDTRKKAVYTEQTVAARVDEAFKGARVGEEITFRQPSHNCAPKFDAGKRYLFYASYDAKTKTWEVYGCNRGSDLEGAADDLLYLRALPLSAQRNRVSGMLEHYEDGPDKEFSLVELLAGAKVRIKGKDKTYEVTTNADGVYELYDLPPGTYSIEPELPFGLKVRFPMQFGPAAEKGAGVTVELGEKTSAGADFVISSDNVLGGRVLGPGGVPLKNVCLELQSTAKGEAGGNGRIFDCTDAEGRYKLEGVPPGKYVIALNRDGKLSGSEPFPTAFYPGTFEREKASIITVGRGDSRPDYDVALPALLPTVNVSGVLLYSDGRPVVREAVNFNVGSPDARYETRSSALTDEAGRFSLTLLKGVPGRLRADMYVYNGKFEKPCPAVGKLLAAGANGMGAVTALTQSVVFEAEKDLSDVRLVFDFPYCPLRKEEKEEKN
jgi:hypothetical protein